METPLRGHSVRGDHEPSDDEPKQMQRKPRVRRVAVGDCAAGSWERLRLTGTDTFASSRTPPEPPLRRGFSFCPLRAAPMQATRLQCRDGRPGSRDRAVQARRSEARGLPEGTAREPIARSTDGGANRRVRSAARHSSERRDDYSFSSSSLVVKTSDTSTPGKGGFRHPPVFEACRGAGPARTNATRAPVLHGDMEDSRLRRLKADVACSPAILMPVVKSAVTSGP
jgi:hypothetical protein